jgi:hypothetical protein
MKKDYFNLEDVAKQLRCEVSDLLHYAAKGELTLSVLMCWRRLNFDHLCRLNFDQGLLLT